MRLRKEIEQDHKAYEPLTLEVLLDIRDLLSKQKPQKRAYHRKKIAKK